jgi:transcription termination/antitermination protein NusG
MLGLTRSAGSLVPIFAEEKQLIQQLIGNTGVAEVSELQRLNDQLKVVKGPLMGLEHVIRKIYGRNRRITTEIPVLGEKKKVELEGYIINSEQKELLE